MRFWLCITICVYLLSFAGCKKDRSVELPIDNGIHELYPLEIPEGFPPMEIPEDNPLTKGKVELGRELFYEKAFSLDSSLACANCHHAEKAFTDGLPVSPGVFGRLGERSSPHLSNIGYKPLLFKDGGIPTLELQALAPFDAHFEFDLNIVEATQRLKRDPYYVERFKEVFNDEPTVYGITRSLASFQRTFVSGNSRYDQHFLQKIPTLNESELNGYSLFTGDRMKCSKCHSGVFFTDYGYENIGLESYYADSGRARITLDPSDAGKFGTPSLRNVALTAPYMFDGRFASLEEVMEHFASGGELHRNKSKHMTGFTMTEEEKQDVIAFLNTLTDEEFLTNPSFRPKE